MVEKITLDNGVRILHERMEGFKSCSLGLWVESGSRHEPESLCGISHYIEHMLFKGTHTRTAAELASGFDALGGQVNAFTTKEHTCFYCRTLGEYLPEAAELLCDMYFNSAFDEQATDLERSVIIEEIGMYEDTPDDLVNEQLFSAVYDGYKLGRPILGTKESLEGINGETLRHYRADNYTPENTVVALCGNYSQKDIDSLCMVFSKMEKKPFPVIEKSIYQPAFTLKTKDTEQNHLMLGFEGLKTGSEERYVMQVLNGILGSGMSSRLFQTVREKNGLCYTVYSFCTAYIDTGVCGIYTALSKETELKAIELILSVLRDIKENGVTQQELQRNITQLKSNVLMGLENNSARMTTMARNEFVYGRQISEEEISRGFDSVTRQQVHEMAQRIFDFSRMSFSAVGKVREEIEYKKVLGM